MMGFTRIKNPGGNARTIYALDSVYSKAKPAVCRNPECLGFIKEPGKRSWVAHRRRNYALRRYCSNKCYERALVINDEGAKERVRQWQLKQKQRSEKE